MNTKPIVPGHCLVLPRRVVGRVQDLKADELADLWAVAAKVGPVLEKQFKSEGLTFAIQDGSAAGQTVPHVHFHILPRKYGDFERNDMVYDEIDRWNRIDADKDRKPRSAEEMKEEAYILRELFDDAQPIPPTEN